MPSPGHRHPSATRTVVITTVVGLLTSSYCAGPAHAFQQLPSIGRRRVPPSPTVRRSTMRNDNISFFDRRQQQQQQRQQDESAQKAAASRTHQQQQQQQRPDGGRVRRNRAAFDPEEMEIVPRKSFAQEDSSYAQECVVTDPRSKACFPFVGMLRDSANYIANHRHTTAVYHIPGELLEWDGFPALMDDIALTWLMGMRVVIVAGCRHQINARLAGGPNPSPSSPPSPPSPSSPSQSHPPFPSDIMPNSLRVTSLETMRIVEEEAGFVRFEIERQLNRSLQNGALTSNVVSGNFVTAAPVGVLPSPGTVNGVDFRYTGVPSTVQVRKIRSLHDRGDLVLLTSCTASASGEHLNVRSESLAAHVAAGMGADKIVYCSNECMVLRSGGTGRTVQNFRSQDARDVLAWHGIRMDRDFLPWIGPPAPSAEGGGGEGLSRAAMEYLLQIGWANLALEHGVGRAHIVAPADGALLTELFTAKDGSGTCISRDEVEEIHPDENFYGDDGGDDDGGSGGGTSGGSGRRSETLPVTPPPRRVRGSEWRTVPFS